MDRMDDDEHLMNAIKAIDRAYTVTDAPDAIRRFFAAQSKTTIESYRAALVLDRERAQVTVDFCDGRIAMLDEVLQEKG
jgi:hypothetical protein